MFGGLQTILGGSDTLWGESGTDPAHNIVLHVAVS